MKPRLPSEVRDGDLCDRKGVPIHVGDLLKSYHFRARRYRRTFYIYHIVMLRDGAMKMVPVPNAAGLVDDGGTCWLHTVANTDGVVASAEVIDSIGEQHFTDRKRRKLTKQEPTQ